MEWPGQSTRLGENEPWGVSFLSLTMGYCESHFISLSISFLICKTGTVTYQLHRIGVRMKQKHVVRAES